MQDSEDYRDLDRMNRHKKLAHPEQQKLGEAMVELFKQRVRRQHAKLQAVSEQWQCLVPQSLQDHASLDDFSRGTLRVRVDTSAHLYDLKQALLRGLEAELKAACRAQGLRKITLKRGSW